eukprot:CAMPEP_0184691992 /NCGR_PEP_ID=MMETSP0313-20130426/646_1 /TAXON_ID=2792 /ORGANISM="Porphyridium aerugineum, Strain SAG 1380-2" /LENGTH=399 /DNA_ID=CAMNT_0027149785 /DNA_START=552 /DNA_END=1751 /DNA_ORIENTATION=-
MKMDTNNNSNNINLINKNSNGQDHESNDANNNSKKERKKYTMTKTREQWTNEEHTMFLEALEVYQRDWKKIEKCIGTKNVVQIRSHAQKHFIKVTKNQTGEVIPPARPKRRRNAHNGNDQLAAMASSANDLGLSSAQRAIKKKRVPKLNSSSSLNLNSNPNVRRAALKPKSSASKVALASAVMDMSASLLPLSLNLLPSTPLTYSNLSSLEDPSMPESMQMQIQMQMQMQMQMQIQQEQEQEREQDQDQQQEQEDLIQVNGQDQEAEQIMFGPELFIGPQLDPSIYPYPYESADMRGENNLNESSNVSDPLYSLDGTMDSEQEHSLIMGNEGENDGDCEEDQKDFLWSPVSEKAQAFAQISLMNIEKDFFQQICSSDDDEFLTERNEDLYFSEVESVSW